MRKIIVQVKENKFPTQIPVTNRKCVICTQRFQYTNNGTEWNNGRADNNCCSNCQFWALHAVADISNDSAVVIKGQHYIAGNNVEGIEVNATDTRTAIYNKIKQAKKGTGFSGEPFIIRKANGEVIVSTDMWHQGSVPAEFSNPDLNNLDIPSFLRKSPMKNNAELVEV